MKSKWITALTLALVAALGVSVFLALMLTRSKPGRQPRRANAPLVETLEARASSVPVMVRSMGGVQAAQTVQLIPQVNGKVLAVSEQLIPGGRVQPKEILVKIDPADYELAVRQARAAVVEAQLALDLQLAHRSVARQELQHLKDKVAPSPEELRLVGRESYVESAKAQLDAAQSRLEQAQLARQRTVLRAPFAARVSEKSVDIGQVVSPQSVLAVLVASDHVWVEATLPPEQLRWIDVPGPKGGQAAPVVVRQKFSGGLQTVRRGEVLGLLPGLQHQGKLARLLVRVDDPFGMTEALSREPGASAQLPLLVGSFVNVEIQGHTLDGLFSLPRGALRDGSQVWVREPEGTLSFRAVEVVWSRDEIVYVRGELKDGDRVVTSRLTAALPGMKVSQNGHSPPSPAARSSSRP